MGDKRNFAALDWVAGEIFDTLKEARQALEAYVEDPKDSTRIRFCLTHIHQVHGSLQMVEFHGAALLAEEMEQAAQAIMDNEVGNIPEAQEVLMRGLLQLPIFIEYVKTKKEDNPAQVMPLLNDLRAVRKQSYLSETNLFSPDLSSVGTVIGDKHVVLTEPEKLLQVLKKLREMYQFAAASVLRGIKVEENLGYLDKVFSRLELISQGTVSFPIWEVSAALVDALKRDDVEFTVAVRGLLRYIARELRIIGEKAPAAFDIAPRESLLKNLLFYVARAEDGSDKVAKVKSKYKLNGALMGANKDDTGAAPSDMLQAPDAEAIRSVVVALQDELTNIKRVLDISLSGTGSSADLKEVLPAVKRVSDTLAVLGIGDLRKQMIEQSERLEKISDANSIDEAELMQTASNIIDIEHRLRAIAKSAGRHDDLSQVDEREVEIDGAKAAVIKECASGLQRSKDAIIDYISYNWDKKHLENVGTILTEIRGGLNMIPLRRPAAIVASCSDFIQERLLGSEDPPSFETQQSLADVFVSVEAYLERLMEDMYEDSDDMLDIAEESVASLGYEIKMPAAAIVADADVSHEALPDVQETSEDSAAYLAAKTAIEEHSEPVSSTSKGPYTPAYEPAEQDHAEPVAETTPTSLDPIVETLPEETQAQSGEQSVPQQQVPAAAEVEQPAEEIEAVIPEPAQPEPSIPEETPHAPIASAPEFESDIDEEIIEIFVEEVGEVLETLEEYFPLWKQKPTDQDSLVVVRRAFHTLKGSGRMVEAFDIGELAWSIENMLNRIIDHSIKTQPHVFNIIEAVIAITPTLLNAFESRKLNPQKDLTSQYEAWANQISEGDFPEELANPVPAFDAAETRQAVENTDDVSTTAVDAQVEVEQDRPDVTEPEVIEPESPDEDSDFDDVLQEIFSQESISHLITIEDFIKRMEQDAPLYSVPSDALQRALHTLKGSAKMAQVWPIAEITEPLEHFTKELITFQVRVDDDTLQLIRDAVDYIRQGLALIESGSPVQIPKIEQFVARTNELRELAVGFLDATKEPIYNRQQKVDPRMLSLVMAEEMALLLDADQLLDRWQSAGNCDGRCDESLNKMSKELSILEQGAQQANLLDMALLSRALNDSYKFALDDKIETGKDFFSLMHSGHESLLAMVDAVAAGQNVVAPPHSLTEAIDALIASAEEAIADDSSVAEESAPQESVVEEDADIDTQASELSSITADDGNDGSEESLETFFSEDALFEETATEKEPTSEQGDQGLYAAEEHSDAEESDITFEFDNDSQNTEAQKADELIDLDDVEADGSELLQSTSQDDPAISNDDENNVLEDTAPISLGIELEGTDTDGESSNSELPTNVDSAAPFIEPADSATQNIELMNESLDIGNEMVGVDLVDISSDVLVESESDIADIEQINDDIAVNDDAIVEDNIGLEDNVILEDDILLDDDISVDDIDVDDSTDDLELAFETLDDEEDDINIEVEELSIEDEIVDDSPGATDESTSVEENSVSVVENSVEESTQIEEVIPDQSDVSQDTPIQEGPAGNVGLIPGLLDDIDVNSEDFDQDILEIFVEEAEELSEGLDEAIHAWQSNWSDGESLEEIKRILHTLKGGARLSGLSKFGDLTHDYESTLIDMGEDLSGVDQNFFEKIHVFQDKVLSATRAVKTFMESDYDIATAAPEVESDNESAVHETSVADIETESAAPENVASDRSDVSDHTEHDASEKDTSEKTEAASPELDANNVVKFEPKPKPIPTLEPEVQEFSMPAVGGHGGGGQQAAAGAALKKAGPQEVVKVSAELLEELVNLAGETSINRSRLEQYVNDFSFALEEVDSTLSRLQDQLRRLDIETEAQILFRQEQMEAHDEFDPLEMDRYSHLQQLSRSLIESASDLTDLKTDLGDKLRVTETLLLQQSRINTTLQEGLMRSRMVPFSRMVPRLRRIVRQVSAELGKNVSFELDNVEGELDRSVLERMVPPFEHMLRNAVDHGIESPEDRLAAGKTESGRIVLTLAREGGDVIIRLADDGRGVDLKRVKEKAIERELMAPDAELSDYDIMQFILHAGFSTAENVTQISGRGVGMDVVSAEIKQLGGSVKINSSWGKGTEFIIRLPFTLSVNRALMVEIGKDHYAVPLSSIEGIVRVSPFELEHYYASPEAQFEYANENYHVRYLGSLLYSGAAPVLEGHVLPLPVMLVRSAEHTMALQVDAVLGSREIVVKSLGQQFSTVPGLSGATVMGDGSVVVILDPHALVRQEIAKANLQLEDDTTDQLVETEEESRTRQIMVVDDSVTVRKVTTRFLEREGFEVITAKDGVDALRLLQEGVPDLMLLDIEMPRMDGFEVAKTVRTTKRWEDLPIIMITSRTGDKHREHALSLGVNNYLGKPYQEDILLDAIGEILDKKSGQQ